MDLRSLSDLEEERRRRQLVRTISVLTVASIFGLLFYFVWLVTQSQLPLSS